METLFKARKGFRQAKKSCNGKYLRACCDSNEIGTTREAGLPNITGSVKGEKEFRLISATGCFEVSNFAQSGLGDTSKTNYHELNIDASSSSPIYGHSNTVIPASVNVASIIYLGK